MVEKEILIRRPRQIKPAHTHNHLTILVVSKSDSMHQCHPSGVSKDEMAEKAIGDLLESMKQSRYRAPNLSFARINYGEYIEVALLPTPLMSIIREKISSNINKGEPRVADALETALYIAVAYKKLNEEEEEWLPRSVGVFLITDVQDIDKESTIRVVKDLNKEIGGMFVFHIPAEECPKKGFDYCASLGHTHSLVDARLISAPFYLDDIQFPEDIFTGFGPL